MNRLAVWLIYAMGGGWGHVTRAIALARAAGPHVSIQILSNSPYIERVHGAPVIPTNRDEAGPRIRDINPDVLIVDTFPRGLGGELAGELAELCCQKVLIHRDLRPEYVDWAGLREFVPRNYDLVIVPGEDEGSAFGDSVRTVTTAPWLVRSAEELREQEDGAQRVLVIGAGNLEELGWYQEVAEALRVPLFCGWPAIEWMPAADVVVGGGGYNTVYECLACRAPLVAKAWPRKYDRQERRLSSAAIRGSVYRVETVAEAVAVARHSLSTGRRERLPYLENGVMRAVELIRGLRDR